MLVAKRAARHDSKRKIAQVTGQDGARNDQRRVKKKMVWESERKTDHPRRAKNFAENGLEYIFWYVTSAASAGASFRRVCEVYAVWLCLPCYLCSHRS